VPQTESSAGYHSLIQTSIKLPVSQDSIWGPSKYKSVAVYKRIMFHKKFHFYS